MSTKVLMVEDHADTSQVVALLLGVEGIAVITAQDGYEGLTKAETEKPNLIIADLELPKLLRLLVDHPQDQVSHPAKRQQRHHQMPFPL